MKMTRMELSRADTEATVEMTQADLYRIAQYCRATYGPIVTPPRVAEPIVLNMAALLPRAYASAVYSWWLAVSGGNEDEIAGAETVLDVIETAIEEAS